MSKESKAYKNLPKKVYIRTFGCQMNVRDSEVACGLLNNAGFEFTDDPKAADIVIINTCAVRQHAEDRVWSEVGRHKDKIVGIIGCMAQEQKERVFERAANIGFVVGPSDIDKIPGIVTKLSEKRGQSPKGGDSPLFLRKIWETDGGIRPEEIYHTGFFADKKHAYVVISEGCSNFCSYCVVPYVRGPLRNRNYKEIIKEIEGAVDQGIESFTLLGQNVNAYVCENISFLKLLELIDRIKGIKEFTFLTSHPKDTSVELFKVMACTGKLKKLLHLPVQSGSDKILKLMNRGYSRKFYLELAQEYRKIVKDGLLSSDIIVGFPTEREEDFLDTYDLVKNVEFDAAYIFKYSSRPNTEAARMVDDVPREEKERRHSLILELQKKISGRKK